MKNVWLIQTGTLAAALGLAIPCANAGAAATQPPQATTADPSRSDSSREIQPYDLEIANGTIVNEGSPRKKMTEATLANVLEVLREKYQGANIVCAPEIGKLRISDLRLRAGSIWEHLEAVRVASGGAFQWSGPGSPTFDGSPRPFDIYTSVYVDPATGISQDGPRPSTGLFVLRPADPSPEMRRMIEVFNLSGYFRQQKQQANATNDAQALEDLMMIIHKTLAMFTEARYPNVPPPDSLAPQMEFHSGANLLVVIGTGEAIEVVRKVVDALPGQIPRASDLYQMQPGGGGGGGLGGGIGGRFVNPDYPRAAPQPALPPGAPGQNNAPLRPGALPGRQNPGGQPNAGPETRALPGTPVNPGIAPSPPRDPGSPGAPPELPDTPSPP